jgi:hypothetical protein
MKLSSRLAVPLLQGAAVVCLSATSALSQIRQIDSSKLPHDSAVQHAYTDLLPIDQYARTYETVWRFPVPKKDVATRFLQALHTLENAQQQYPDNKELQLFAGLVAHLAYNLEIEQAYDPALKFLQPQPTADFRAAWFLGIHECQAIDRVSGMQRLLQVESASASLPGGFWQDYANCAIAANMPVHAIRAYDKARKATDPPAIDDPLEQTVRDRIKPGRITDAYPAKQAWRTEKAAGGMRSTSKVCGESFAIRLASRPKIGDVVNGMCVVTIDTDNYPSRYGPSSASILLLTQTARTGETLEAFSQRLLKDPLYAKKKPLAGVHCPVTTCLAFEVDTNQLYKSEGGAHLLAVFFESDQPAYPGLKFETPQPQQKITNHVGESNLFKPEENPQRFSGPLYTFVSLDANHDIYPRSRADFDDLLKSLVIDSR